MAERRTEAPTAGSPAAGADRDLAVYRRLMALARPYWPHIGGLLLLNLLAPPLALLSPVPLKIAVDSALAGRPLPRVLGMLGLPPSTMAIEPARTASAKPDTVPL